MKAVGVAILITSVLVFLRDAFLEKDIQNSDAKRISFGSIIKNLGGIDLRGELNLKLSVQGLKIFRELDFEVIFAGEPKLWFNTNAPSWNVAILDSFIEPVFGGEGISWRNGSAGPQVSLSAVGDSEYISRNGLVRAERVDEEFIIEYLGKKYRYIDSKLMGFEGLGGSIYKLLVESDGLEVWTDFGRANLGKGIVVSRNSNGQVAFVDFVREDRRIEFLWNGFDLVAIRDVNDRTNLYSIKAFDGEVMSVFSPKGETVYAWRSVCECDLKALKRIGIYCSRNGAWEYVVKSTKNGIEYTSKNGSTGKIVKTWWNQSSRKILQLNNGEYYEYSY